MWERPRWPPESQSPRDPNLHRPTCTQPTYATKELQGLLANNSFKPFPKKLWGQKWNQLTSIKKKKKKNQPSEDQVGFLKAFGEKVSGLQSGDTSRHKQQHSQKNPFLYLCVFTRENEKWKNFHIRWTAPRKLTHSFKKSLALIAKGIWPAASENALFKSCIKSCRKQSLLFWKDYQWIYQMNIILNSNSKQLALCFQFLKT